ncbi:MAG: polynucleotide adenylyltransferase, partial [Lachnospiraceae bacterium]|nr:polynucleotide adenylyltransferase [Lachnospiraceae bacterium]
VNPALPKQKHMRWAAFLKNAGTEDAVQILKDLKLDNDTITRVRTLNQWIYRTILPEKTEIRRAMSQMEDSLFDDLLILKDSLGEPGVEKLERLKGEIRRDGDCLRLKNLAVSGRDLMEAGVQPGKQVGEELARLLDAVLEEPGKNQKDVLLGMILKGR